MIEDKGQLDLGKEEIKESLPKDAEFGRDLKIEGGLGQEGFSGGDIGGGQQKDQD